MSWGGGQHRGEIPLPVPCASGAERALCPHAQGPSPCRPQEPVRPPAPGTKGPSTGPTVQAWHGLALGPRDTSRTSRGWGGHGSAPPTVTPPSPGHPVWQCPWAALPLSTCGPAAARLPLQSTPSGVSTLPALQTRHTGGSTGQHVHPGAPPAASMTPSRLSGAAQGQPARTMALNP